MSISFIIPIYNTKINLLKRCVSSIEKLKITDYEIIAINDGSNNIITRKYRDFLASKKNIIYLENKNKGVSYSRNCGINKATKEYITFVDSDDVVLHESFKEKDIEFGEDIILFTYRNKLKDRSVKYPFSPGLVTRNTLLEEAVSTCNCCNSCAKLFKRKFLVDHNILFDESFIQGEDALFVLRCLESDPTIRYYEILFYEYDYNGSNTKERWKNNFEKCLHNKYYIYSKKRELICNLCVSSERKKLLIKNDNEFIRSIFHSYKFLVAINDKEKIRQYIEKFKHVGIDKNVLDLKGKFYYGLLLNNNLFTTMIVNLIRVIR